jgi:hypothetical protein
VLGEAPDGYGIWDSLAGNELVERFPLTEEGIDRALERFDELKRRDRRERWNLFRVAWIATVAGAVVWLLAGTLATLFFTFGTGQPGPWIAGVLFGLDALGYRLAVGSLVVLTVLLLLQRVPGTRSHLPSVAGSLEEPQSRGWDLVLRTGLVAGLAVWTFSAIATEALFRVVLGPNPSRAAIASQLASTLAFRTWVAALVLLVIRRLRLRRTAPTAPESDEG